MVLLVHMADRRRLQGEIDKTLKKVNEGVDAFDDVWNKLVIVSRLQVQTATNVNQKEKYESELKKEIKKLQRLREQIKTWQSSNEIKDKKPLLEARKNIEQQMERFKVIERETKQKPYSKDALGNNYKFDPHHKEQEEIREWLQGCNNKLSAKIEELEGRLDDLNANKKKRIDKEKIEQTKNSLDTHRHYLDTLERISNMVSKKQFSVKKVQEIRYDIDDFIENSDQPDYSINPDLFEELELDKYDSSTNNDEDDSDQDSVEGETDGEDEVTDHDQLEEEEEEEEEEGLDETEEELEDTEQINGKLNKSKSSASNHTKNNNRNRGNSSASSVSSSSSSVPPTTNDPPPINNTDDDKRRRHKSESGLLQSQPSDQTTIETQRNTNNNSPIIAQPQKSTSSKRYANGNHVVSASNNPTRLRTNSGVHTGNSSTCSTSSSLSSFSSTSKDNNKIPAFDHVNEINDVVGDSMAVPPLCQSPFASVVAGTTGIVSNVPVLFSAAVSTNQKAQKLGNNELSTSPKDSISNSQIFLNQQQQQLSNLIAAANGSITNLSQLNGLVLPSELDKKLSDVVLTNNATFIPTNNNNPIHMNTLKSMAENVVLAQQATLSTNSTGGLTNPTDLASLLEASLPSGLSDDPSTAAALAALIAQQKANGINLPASLLQGFGDGRSGLSVQAGGGQQNSNGQSQNISPATTNQETFIQPILGVAPLGKTSLSKEQNQQLQILESAFKKLPHPSDTERMRNYLPRILINTPNYYPQTPPNGHDSIDFLNKLTSDSLFFMFYYMEGTKAQFLAAQALKKLSWRFHTRYMMWFQRFEEPKVITDEYEMGTYVYFDFEKWGQRKKEGFTFEYKYLEDRDLSSY
jgi:CCR4-NOT transcription complex subunit 3